MKLADFIANISSLSVEHNSACIKACFNSCLGKGDTCAQEMETNPGRLVQVVTRKYVTD